MRYEYRHRPPLQFRAEVQTHSLSFTIDAWPESAGIFNSDSDVVDLAFGSAVALTAENGDSAECLANSAFSGVNLLSMHMPAGLRVALDGAASGRLGYTLTPLKKPATDSSALYLTIMVPRGAQTRLACTGSGAKDAGGRTVLSGAEWRVTSPEANGPIEFTVRFRAKAGDRSSATEHAARGPEPEQLVPVADASNVNFPGGGPFAGNDNKLQITDPKQEIKLSDGLRVEGTKKTAIKELGYDPQSGLLAVSLAGSASHIRVGVGEDESDVLPPLQNIFTPRGLVAFVGSHPMVLTVASMLISIASLFVAVLEFRK